MTRPSQDLDQRAVELRRAFDEAFSRPIPARDRDSAEFLIILVRGQAHAVRIAALAGIEVDRRIAAVPVAAPGLLGLCAVHGEPVPVFDLAVILGGKPATTPARWLALYRDAEPLALAFDDLREIRRVPLQAIVPASAGAGTAGSRHESISFGDGVIHVIDVPSIVALIRSRTHRPETGRGD